MINYTSVAIQIVFLTKLATKAIVLKPHGMWIFSSLQIKILVVSHSTYYLGLQEMIVWGGGIKCTFK
jgi:hypothetical protein